MILKNHSNMPVWHFLLLSVLKTVVLPNFFVETNFFQDSSINKELKSNYLIDIFCNIINVFTVTFDQLNVSLLNKSKQFL